MSNTDAEDAGANTNGPPSIPLRESLIATAVHFLSNPNVRRSPLQQKQSFLRSKGLTDDEVQIACERAGVFTTDPNSAVINMGIDAQKSSAYIIQHRPSTLSKIRDVLTSLALVGGIAYAIYIFYKKYIEPFLFGRKKKKTIEDSIDEMDKKVEKQINDLNTEISRVRQEVNRVNYGDVIHREFNNFKSDLEAIKGLLLNRKQFANPIAAVPASIPAWQLTSQSQSEAEPDKNDDAGSGSGSSETEVVTKNSDSSLEIM